MFKSYYVVWKQVNVLTARYFFPLFKSYYVVWKQNKMKNTKRVEAGGLNRTM